MNTSWQRLTALRASLAPGLLLFSLSVPSAALDACGTSAGSSASQGPADASSVEAATEAGAQADPRIAEFLTTAADAVTQAHIVGAGLALVVDGRIAYAGGLGTRTPGGMPVDGDTLFLAGSTTKMLTVAAVLSLVDEGKVDLQAPLPTYLPGLAVQSPFDVRAMTVSGLLSHTDGLEDSSPPQCALARFSDYGASSPVTLWGTPGEFFDYSNDDMALAARVIESFEGAGSYESFVHDRVFSRAGMSTATFDAAGAARSANVATGYLADSTGAFTTSQTIDAVVNECPFLEPAGYAVASARDFAGFVATLLAGGGTMLKPATVTRMETGVLATGLRPNVDEAYGYGFFIDQVGGETVIEHPGDVGAFHSFVVFVPATRFGFVLHINLVH